MIESFDFELVWRATISDEHEWFCVMILETGSKRRPISDPFNSLFDARASTKPERIHSPFMVDLCGRQAAAKRYKKAS